MQVLTLPFLMTAAAADPFHGIVHFGYDTLIFHLTVSPLSVVSRLLAVTYWMYDSLGIWINFNLVLSW